MSHKYALEVKVKTIPEGFMEIHYKEVVADREDIRNELRTLGNAIESGDEPFASDEYEPSHTRRQMGDPRQVKKL